MEQGEYINVNSSFDWTLSKEDIEDVIRWHKVNWDSKKSNIPIGGNLEVKEGRLKEGIMEQMEQKTFEEICNKHHLTKMSISKNLTYVSQDKTEGFEFELGKIKDFTFKDGIRSYNQPLCDKMQKIYEELINAHKTKKETKEPKVDNGKDKELVNDGKLINNLPSIFDGKRIIVPQDIEELKQMSTFGRILLFQKTHPSIIKEKNGRGGKQKYVEGNIMKLEANIAFLFQISSKIDGWQIDEKGVSCYGSMIVNIDGKEIVVSDIGNDLQEYKKDTKEPVFTVHEMMKNACTDMKKRCLACMGFNGDVYRGEV